MCIWDDDIKMDIKETSFIFILISSVQPEQGGF
jgi:hypothetical protein